jgi:hypothetical protein
VQEDPSLLLDYDFIMNIFEPLYGDLLELEEFLEFYREDKRGNVHGLCHPDNRILVIDLAIAEVFFPVKLCNRETAEFCIKLAKAIATVLLVELEDTSKATHQYVYLRAWEIEVLPPSPEKRSYPLLDYEQQMILLRVHLLLSQMF